MTTTRNPRQPQLPDERIEYSNVTDLRQSLLPVVEKLQNAPAIRYIITKHGRPQAVLMSFQTYELLKRIVSQFVERTDDSEEAAIDRLRAEGGSELTIEPAPVRVMEEKIAAKAVLVDAMRELREIEQKFKVKLRRLDEEEERAQGTALAE